MALIKRYYLEFTVFICGAVLMILELVGSRVMAPYVGTTIYVWTSIIGIIMASLSVGYWLGGKLADKYKDQKTLSLIILAAAFSIGFIILIDNYILDQMYILSIEWRSLIGALILFAPASVFLGMVTPFAVKLRFESENKTGRTVGNLYAISTTGSIVGTFLAGFILMATLGTRNILMLLTITLFLLGIFIYPNKKREFKKILIISLFFILIVFIGKNLNNLGKGVVDIDTRYGRYMIFDRRDVESDREIRILASSRSEWQSAIYTDTYEPANKYVSFFSLADYFNKDINKALVLGGGAYTHTTSFAKSHPKSKVDIVEIDPELDEIAEEYFGFKKTDNMTIHNRDARDFLNSNEKQYDAIYVDVFTDFIPFHVATKETVKKIYEALDENGVVVMNIISSLEGDKSQFLRAEYKTYKETFPNIYLFAVDSTDDGTIPQNIILVATKKNDLSFKKNDPAYGKFFKNQWDKTVQDDLPILTDDYAPTDDYIKEIIMYF